MPDAVTRSTGRNDADRAATRSAPEGSWGARWGRRLSTILFVPSSNLPLPVTPARRGRNITRAFLLTGALAICLFAIGMASLLSDFIGSRLLQRDAELSRDFVQSMMDTQGASADLHAGHVEPPPALAEFFDHISAMPDVLRANVYTPDKTLLWSSTSALVGRQFSDNAELDEALTGQVVAHFDDAPDLKDEHALLGADAQVFVENYLPIRSKASDRVLGVVELYRRPAALTSAVRSGQLRIWLGAAVGGAAVILSLLWFVRRIERDLRDQQSRLIDGEALAMVGELSAAVAHSIRNPLGSIRSAAELQSEYGSEMAMAPEEVIRHVDRIEHLVRTLLTCAGEQGARPGRCALAAALSAAARRLGPELTLQGKHLVTQWPDDLGDVALDEILLAQALASVLSNAAEATQAGDRILITARREGGWLLIDVDDEGQGVPDHLAGRADQPFVTSKPRGLGLGLPLARRVMERAGGRLSLGPRVPKGTHVRLMLPMLPQISAPETALD
jgi:signal transduction histidine kinase